MSRAAATTPLVLIAAFGTSSILAGDEAPTTSAPPDAPQHDRVSLADRLSLTGMFTDLQSLTPAPAFIPYDINVPFWSDGATKRRWMAIPDGKTIMFSRDDEWTFPAGTIFVKHFELPLDENRPGATRRLETRLLVCGSAGEVSGASYRWRPDGSDADLVREATVEDILIEADRVQQTRRWYYPSPDDCRKCHLPAAGGVLGVNTRQLNRLCESRQAPSTNQLAHWHRLGVLKCVDPSQVSTLPALSGSDEASISLEERARSFLDVNCGYCHRPGGAAADFDARFATPLHEQRLLGVSARINLGIDGAKFIAPNDPWRSMVLVRMGMVGETGMPPLAHQAIDQKGCELLRDWIESLPGPPTLAPPVIEQLKSKGDKPLTIELRHDDSDAVVRYTLDGGTPGGSSPIYERPLELTESTTVRARAYRSGWNRSIAVHATFVVGR